MQLRTDGDSVLMVVSDGEHASHLVGGDMQTIHAILLNLMKKNAKVAEMICQVSLDFHMQLMQLPILRIEEPPLPKDGLADWPNHNGLLMAEES